MNFVPWFVSVSAIDRDPGLMGQLDYSITNIYYGNLFMLQPSSNDPNIVNILINKSVDKAVIMIILHYQTRRKWSSSVVV